MTKTLSHQVKDELVGVEMRARSAQVAEVAAMLRVAGQMTQHGLRVVYEVELDHAGAARRLARTITELFEVPAEVHEAPAGADKPDRYRVLVERGLAEVIRRCGLVTRSGTEVVGLPPQLIAGTVSDKEAAWRGAFLAAGVLADPGRAATLEAECPRPEVALALVGCARQLGASAKTRESRGVERVVVRDAEAIGALLTRMGAQRMRLKWDVARQEYERQAPTGRLANFDDANLRRSARAAVAAALRVERAMEILGDDVPEHLADAGQLRVRYQQASLEELGKLADPSMTKDAIAGRIRRLLSTADKCAAELGVPDTLAAVPPEGN